MAYQTLIVEIEDYVALIRLNRPEALNALNSALLAELGDALKAADADTAPADATAALAEPDDTPPVKSAGAIVAEAGTVAAGAAGTVVATVTVTAAVTALGVSAVLVAP